jgi:hypothetical protein
MAVDAGLRWNNRFAALGPSFHTRLAPHPLPDPYWVGKSRAVAGQLGLSDAWMDSPVALEVFAGNLPLCRWPASTAVTSLACGPGSWAMAGRFCWVKRRLQPGHRNSSSKARGSRPTRAWATGGPCCAPASANSCVPRPCTVWALPPPGPCASQGRRAKVYREEAETAAVVTRVAPSFIRFGHFEHFAARDQVGPLRVLADYVIDHFYPECRSTGRHAGNPYAALLEAVAASAQRPWWRSGRPWVFVMGS